MVVKRLGSTGRKSGVFLLCFACPIMRTAIGWQLRHDEWVDAQRVERSEDLYF
jgi:hypothetical protein